MGWPDDTVAGVYLFLFAFGFVFSIVSLLLGAGHDQPQLHGHGHLGHGHAAGHGHASTGSPPATVAHGHGQGADGHTVDRGHDRHGRETRAGNPSPINISTVMVFLTWFGAAGYILRVYYGVSGSVSALAASGAGATGAVLVYLFMVRVLWRGQTRPLDPADYMLPGTPARVTQPIRAGGTGEIVYMVDNKRRVDGARSIDGGPIPAGSEVTIVRYEGGLAYVEPAEQRYADGPFQGQPVEPSGQPSSRRAN